jgi:FdhD protein
MVQMADVLRSVDVVRVRGGARAAEVDRAATEEPLEIRLHGRPFAVIMRTPGADRELAAGFLLSERIIISADDLGTIEYCTDRQGPAACPEVRRGEGGRDDESGPAAGAKVRGGDAGHDDGASNVVNVTLANGSDERLDRLMADRRQVMTNSSCGLCGRRTIESLALDVAPIRSAWSVRASALAALPERLRARQAIFDETGGLHAAGLFTRDGEIVDVAEDVGRHNAVDKIVGRGLMRDALPLADYVLCVSGRTSFEIVQKAIVAGIPIVAAVSAPSSLAIELAQECGVTLVGFIRGDSFNIYAHPERVSG